MPYELWDEGTVGEKYRANGGLGREFYQLDGTAVYVSWNGDTETSVWKFYESCGERRLLDQSGERTGFETGFWSAGHMSSALAEAYGSRGEMLVISPVKAGVYRSRLQFS
ncbi:hypothetical protein PHISP_05366 [Aspergillus sp. HF37]|nr:hypothetical protein PHISP_05366 [Aspergillus sp. HF37]